MSKAIHLFYFIIFLNIYGVLLSAFTWLAIIIDTYFSTPTLKTKTQIVGSLILFILLVVPSIVMSIYILLSKNLRKQITHTLTFIIFILQMMFYLPYLLALYIIEIQCVTFEILLLPGFLLYQLLVFIALRCMIKEA